MIKRIDNADEIFSFSKSDIYAIRIKALLKSYGTSYDFAKFYICFSDYDEPCAIISSLDNDFTLSYSMLTQDNADEICAFITSIGYNSLLTDSEFVITGTKYDSGIVMQASKRYDFPLTDATINEYPKLMDLFNLDSYDKWDFEAWYVDLSHRIRHGTAKAYSLNINDEIISSAVYSSIYKDDAILTSVETVPEYRGLGWASQLVSYMLGDIKGNVYLMREENKNEQFYLKLGFTNCGRWRMYK